MNWPLVKISEFCQTGSGGTPSRKKPELYSGKIPWVKSGDLRENTVLEASEYISETALKESSAKLVPKGAVLLAMYGATVGRMAMLGIDAATNQAVCNIIPKPDKAIPKYVYYALLNKVPEFLNNAVGGAQPNISQSIIKDTQIPLPPLEEQKRIAAILDKTDAIRRKRQQAIQLADDFLRAVFLDMFGDPVTNPKGWPTATLDSICVRKGEYGSNQPATNFEEGDYRYIRITDIQDDGSLKEERVSLENQETEALKYTLTHGDLLFARSGATVGKTYLYDEKEGPCIFAGYLIRFKVIPEKAHPEFIKAVCNTQAYWNWVKSCQNVVAQPNINAKQYGQELTFSLPPLKLQKKFIELSKKTNTLIVKNKKINTKNLFEALIQKHFGNIF